MKAISNCEKEMFFLSKLTDKVAVITGGSGGIGKVVAERFLKEGAKVAIVDLKQETLDEVQKDLGDSKDLLLLQADVTKEEDVKNYVSKTVEAFGAIDIFFNNAGIEGNIEPIIETSLEDFEKVQKVNVNGVFLGLKYVLPVMMKQGYGSVINTSSTAGFGAVADLAPYIASKHAVAGLTKSAALETADKQVRVNSIHPAPVNTRMMRSIETGYNPDDTDSIKDQFSQSIPLGRYGEAKDIANLVTFLASDESDFITGAQYRIDGGMGAVQ